MRSKIAVGLGLSLLSLSILVGASAIYPQAVSEPDDPFSQIGTGPYEGDAQQDEATWRRAILLEPTDGFAYYSLGNALVRLGRSEAAIAAYQKASQYADPTNALAYKNLGILLHFDGQYEEAAIAYRASLQADPEIAETHQMLGELMAYTGDYDAAQAAFQDAIRLDPGNGDLYSQLGEAFLATEQFEPAEAAYREATRLNPDYEYNRRKLARALFQQGKVDEAIAAYENIYYDIGNELRTYERYAQAEVAFREAIRINPDFVDAHIQLGITLQDLGQSEAAEVAYQAAEAIEPGASAGLGQRPPQQ